MLFPRKLPLLLLLPLAGAWSWQAVTGAATVRSETATIYWRASTDSVVIKTLQQGEPVRVDFSISGAGGAWCSVVEPGRTESSGYVLCRHLRMDSRPSALAAPAGATPIRFRFQPPDGTSFVQTLKVIKVKEADNGRRIAETGEARSRIVIRKTPGGYSWVQTLLSLEMTQNGKPVPQAAFSQLEGLSVTYELDENGRLLQAGGTAAIADRMRQMAPPAVSDWLASLLGEQTLAGNAAYEWDARIGSFSGLEARPGEVRSGSQRMPVPGGGAAAFLTTTRFDGLVKCGSGSCARISFSFRSSDPEIAAMIGRITGDLWRITRSGAAPQIEDVGIEGSGERLIDPNTMLIHSERVDRATSVKLTLPTREAATATIRETREYSYDFSVRP